MEAQRSLRRLLEELMDSEARTLEERRAQLEKVCPPFATLLQLKRGTVFIHAGGAIDEILLLGGGSVYIMNHTISGKRVIADTLSSPQILGIIEAQCGLKEFKGTVVTLTPCLVIRIQRRAFQTHVENDLVAMRLLLRYYAEFSLHTIENTGHIRAMGTEDKLVHYLYSRCLSKPIPVRLTEHKSFMADAVGISERSLFRHLETLERSGYLRREGQEICVDKAGFRAMEQRIRGEGSGF